jgi:hypothetical protein
LDASSIEDSSMEASNMEAGAEDRKTHYKAVEECQECMDGCYIDYFNLFPMFVNMDAEIISVAAKHSFTMITSCMVMNSISFGYSFSGDA